MLFDDLKLLYKAGDKLTSDIFFIYIYITENY